MTTATLAQHPILASGLGTRNRMAALRKVLRQCAPGESVLVALNAALIEYGEPVPTTAPVETPDAPKRGRGRPKGSKDSAPRKSRKPANGKAATTSKSHATDTVPCMVCYKQTPRVGSTFYASFDTYVCPSCERESAEDDE